MQDGIYSLLQIGRSAAKFGSLHSTENTVLHLENSAMQYDCSAVQSTDHEIQPVHSTLYPVHSTLHLGGFETHSSNFLMQPEMTALQPGASTTYHGRESQYGQLGTEQESSKIRPGISPTHFVSSETGSSQTVKYFEIPAISNTTVPHVFSRILYENSKVTNERLPKSYPISKVQPDNIAIPHSSLINPLSVSAVQPCITAMQSTSPETLFGSSSVLSIDNYGSSSRNIESATQQTGMPVIQTKIPPMQLENLTLQTRMSVVHPENLSIYSKSSTSDPQSSFSHYGTWHPGILSMYPDMYSNSLDFPHQSSEMYFGNSSINNRSPATDTGISEVKSDEADDMSLVLPKIPNTSFPNSMLHLDISAKKSELKTGDSDALSNASSITLENLSVQLGNKTQRLPDNDHELSANFTLENFSNLPQCVFRKDCCLSQGCNLTWNLEVTQQTLELWRTSGPLLPVMANAGHWPSDYSPSGGPLLASVVAALCGRMCVGPIQLINILCQR